MARHKYFKYTVKGAGEFPYDMLRYDASFPDGPGDTRGLGTRSREQRSVTLVHVHVQAGSWEPTADRWRSFLWTVTDVQEVH